MFSRKKDRRIEYATEIPAFDGLVPAKKALPKWYKDTPRYAEDSNPNILPLKLSFKACLPFLDSLTAGYVLVTPCDIGVDNSSPVPIVTWNSALTHEPLIPREGPATSPNYLLPTPEGCSPMPFAWKTRVTFSIPKNYSVLITHPFNRFDLPFVTLSGITDGEMVMHSGSLPVFFKRNFNGIIPRDTPFAQILPFKRENWESGYNAELFKQEEINLSWTKSISQGWYKRTHWHKKYYN